MRALRAGLTGGIGSGKSTVAQYMAQRGVALIDTDAISRMLTAPGGLAIEPVRDQFGDRFIDAQGGLHRVHMRELVFADLLARQALEALLHPLIDAEAESQALASQAAVQVFDIPLLVETGRWRQKLHRVIVVDCDEATQIQRVSQRPGWSRTMAQQVVRQQASRDNRRVCADILITNQDIDFHGLSMLADAAVQQLRDWACGTISVAGFCSSTA
jgi:dephospho-CoA kinase